jgi:hypothetical protein
VRKALLLFAVLVTLASCGTRLPESAFESSAGAAQREDGGEVDGAFDDGAADDPTATTLADLLDDSPSAGPTGPSGGDAPADDAAPNMASDAGFTEL